MSERPGEATRVTSRALVLGGGGSLGRAFHSGLAAGFLENEIDLRDADLIIGTSAGAVTGAQLGLGIDLSQGPPAIDQPSSAPTESIAAAFRQLMAGCVRAAASTAPEGEWRKIGEMALAAPTPSEQESVSRGTLAALAGLPWPSNFRATAVNAATGQFRIWDAAANVPLQYGVASSGALPGVWPPVTINDGRYVDGGVRSMLNADLAIGSNRVLVISCFDLSSSEGAPEATRLLNAALRREIDQLRASGANVELIEPDEPFLNLSGYGARMLDASLVPQAYEIAKEQARRISDRIRKWA